MTARLFFNRLTILGLIAAMMFFFKPAITQGEELAGVEPETPLEEEVFETYEETAGLNYQYTWVPASDFEVGWTGNMIMGFDETTLAMYRYSGSTGTNGVVANIRLPSGAYLYQIQYYYKDTSGSALDFFAYRVPYNGTIASMITTAHSVNGGTVANCTVNSAYRTIANRNYLYYVWVNFNATGKDLELRGARLYWKRQIRPGLSHPFTDIGHLPTLWQDSIAALKASGITSGTTATTYSPDANLTRGQMAVFLAKALGLYWAGSSGY